MTRIKKNFLRMFLCLTLVMATIAGSTMTANAQIGGANEVWRGSDLSGHVTMHDTNTTPVKIMGQSGNLRLWFAFQKVNANEPDINIKIQVRNLTQNTTTDFIIPQMVSIDERVYKPSIYVNNGDRIQIFFDICTAPYATPPGYKRSAVVQFGYDFV